MKNFRINEYFVRGSGGLLGPSWTFPDTFWTILKELKMLIQVVPKDLERPPKHIPDDPKQVQKSHKI